MLLWKHLGHTPWRVSEIPVLPAPFLRPTGWHTVYSQGFNSPLWFPPTHPETSLGVSLETRLLPKSLVASVATPPGFPVLHALSTRRSTELSSGGLHPQRGRSPQPAPEPSIPTGLCVPSAFAGLQLCAARSRLWRAKAF